MNVGALQAPPFVRLSLCAQAKAPLETGVLLVSECPKEKKAGTTDE